ncbi:MAG: glucosaminidase domain-containing protein [Campylobacterota bacterium]|nr:glucosaminidase domain-containing protein [Campylobacterota bacterium]
MNRYALFILLTATILFTGCNNNTNVKLLNKNFLDTKVGKIIDQKMSKEVVIKKPIVIEKKIEKKIVKKKTKKPNITVQQKKQHFKDILVPIATEVYHVLEKQYQSILRDMQTDTNREYIEKLKIEYKAKTDEELLYALKPHPISILLAQAAIESAWLTSRFTKSANNIFGVWSFNKKEPRIAANATRGTKKIYLKKYKTFKSAVFDYYKTLAKSWAYPKFREKRTLTDDPYILVDYLESYSEKKKVYTDTLKKMIEYNKFYEYDIK